MIFYFPVQRPVGALLARTSATAVSAAKDENGEPLYRRPVRAELPGPVRHGFVPEELYVFYLSFERLGLVVNRV